MENRVNLEDMNELLLQYYYKVVAWAEESSFLDEMEAWWELGEEVAIGVAGVKTAKKILDISHRLDFMKIKRYLQGVTTIPYEKRERYLELVGKKKFNRESVFILSVVTQTEDLDKLDIYVKLFSLKLEESITQEEFTRWMLMVQKTVAEDLEYMRKDISTGSFMLSCPAEEGLLGAGWLRLKQIAISTSFEGYGKDGTSYLYTFTAKDFCQKVYQVSPKFREDAAGGVILESFDKVQLPE